MFGKNKILKAEIHDGLNLDVQEIFPTIQGEGPYVGYPAVFIRLGGCNLACSFCDTEFDSYQNFSLEKIIAEVQKLAQHQGKQIVRTCLKSRSAESEMADLRAPQRSVFDIREQRSAVNQPFTTSGVSDFKQVLSPVGG